MTTQFLQVEPTTKCNFTCGYCCGRVMPQQNMSMATFGQVLERFRDVTHVQLQGEGEPLLNPHFFDMAEMCRRRGIDVSCITNGSLITAKAAGEFVRLAFRRVNISIDTADPIAFERIRGGKLASVIKGANTLMQAVRAADAKRPLVGLSVTVLRSTLNGLQGVIELYEQLGLTGGLKVQPLQPMASYVAAYKQTLMQEMLNDQEREQLSRLLPRSSPATVCPWLEKGAYVNYEGQVTGCCQIKQHQSFGFGHVGIHALADIEQQRELSHRMLCSGVIPRSCEGCTLATMVAQHHRQDASDASTIERQDLGPQEMRGVPQDRQCACAPQPIWLTHRL